jgi:hypothetical protein
MSSPQPLMKLELELCRVLGGPRHPTRISRCIAKAMVAQRSYEHPEIIREFQKAYGYDEARPPAQATGQP